MSNIFTTDKKKKVVLISIYATLAVIVCLLAALLITQITKPVDDVNEGGGQTPVVEEYTGLTVTAAEASEGTLVIVNAEHQWLIEDDPKMVNVKEKYPNIPCDFANYLTCRADATAAKHFNNMMTALYAAKPDVSIYVNGAYRSFAEQSGSTPAGQSEYHTGLSFKLNHDASTAINATSCAWLYEHAHEYGFIARYPAEKSDITGIDGYGVDSIFRYVGVVHATYMYENDLCLEEYLQLLRGHTFENPLVLKSTNYEIYYATANEFSQIKVPTRYAYTISGDNAGGYIVTVNKAQRVTATAQ